MAGLAALLSLGSDRTDSAIFDKMSSALATRGWDEARASIGAAAALVRSALPMVSEFGDAIMVVDGIAEPSTLADRFVAHGAPALLTGPLPYALILAGRSDLVLARNGDGPPLYYARTSDAVLVASEPAALLAAGVPADPDQATIDRFLADGHCDDTPSTFIESIRQVLPNQVVEISQVEGRAVRRHSARPGPAAAVQPRMALLAATAADRAGVLLGSGLPGAALLGAALTERKLHRTVPVYSIGFPGMSDSASAYTSQLLAPLPDVVLRHRPLAFFADELDIDGFLADVGEPMPDLASYLLWAAAKATGGEVDILLAADGLHRPGDHLARLADRIAARYGVSLCLPYRRVRTEPDDAEAAAPDSIAADSILAELRGIAERTLPAATVRVAASAEAEHALDPPLTQVLLRLRAELFEALLYPYGGSRDDTALVAAQQVCSGRQASGAAGSCPPDTAEHLWRRYLVERWLHRMAPKAAVPTARRPGRAAHARLTIAGRPWTRQALAVEPVAEGDRLAEKMAWYVAEYIDTMDVADRSALSEPWHLLVAAKPAAVSQGRARLIWQIKPSRMARRLARIAGAACGFGDPWSMQLAIEQGGAVRMAAAVLSARFGRLTWTQKLLDERLRSISPPRGSACPPAHLAVILPPRNPDQIAEHIRAAVRRALPAPAYETLAGCAVVSVDDREVRILGWSGEGEPPLPLLLELCADNPFGQNDERTPLLLATSGHREPARRTGRKADRQPARQTVER